MRKANQIFGLGLGMFLIGILLLAIPINAGQFVDEAPVMDGLNTGGEYNVTSSIYQDIEDTGGSGSIGNQTVYVMNDANWLYVYVDMEAQNASITDGYVEIYIDVDRDEYINSTYEPALWIYWDTSATEYWISPINKWHARDYDGYWGLYDTNITTNYSVQGIDGNMSFGASYNNATEHWQVEMRIPLTVDGLYDMEADNAIQILLGDYVGTDEHPGEFTGSVIYNSNTTWAYDYGYNYTLGTDPYQDALQTPSDAEDDVEEAAEAEEEETVDEEEEGADGIGAFFGTTAGAMVAIGVTVSIVLVVTYIYWVYFKPSPPEIPEP